MIYVAKYSNFRLKSYFISRKWEKNINLKHKHRTSLIKKQSTREGPLLIQHQSSAVFPRHWTNEGRPQKGSSPESLAQKRLSAPGRYKLWPRTVRLFDPSAHNGFQLSKRITYRFDCRPIYRKEVSFGGKSDSKWGGFEGKFRVV